MRTPTFSSRRPLDTPLPLLRDGFRWCSGLAIVFIAVAIIGVLVGEAFRVAVITGGLLLFFVLPGLGFTYLLLPPAQEPLLRLALLVPFSMALQPVGVFFASRLLHVPVAVGTSLVVSALLTLLGFALALLRWRRVRQRADLPR